MLKNAHLPFWATLLPVCVALLGLFLQGQDPLPVSTLRLAVFDGYQRLNPRDYQPAPVVVLDIDEASLAHLGQWPWPRTRLAELVETLDALGAAVVAFDVVFAEADRTSPLAMAAVWGLSTEERAALAHLPDHDALFARHLTNRPVVLGHILERSGFGRAPAFETAAQPWRTVFRGEGHPHPQTVFSGVTPSLPSLVAQSAGYGALSFLPDHDGVVRRVPLMLTLDAQPVPTLVAEALRVALGEKSHVLTWASPPPGVSEWRSGPLAVPLTDTGELWVHYTRPRPERRLAAWRVWADEQGLPEAALTPEDIEGRIVLVGSSAPGLMDLRFSPLGGIIPGVEVHAQALEQILLGTMLDRPKTAPAIEAVALVFSALVAGFSALFAPALLAAFLSVLLCGGLAFGGWWAFSSHSVLLDPGLAIAAALLSFSVAGLVRHRLAEQKHRYLKTAFARYVSPNRVEHLLQHPDALALGGERRQCSFLFTDLAGFTPLMETLDPADAVSMLNNYLDGMIRIAFEHHGTLDRIVGDAVAILFSAPLPQANHAERAVLCALAMKTFSEAYAANWQAQGIAFGRTRFGVHSGDVIVGNFGGQTMFDYRALGDAVNTAARLESVNKQLGTWVCVSEFTLSLCKDPHWHSRPVGRLVLKGKTEALKVHEVQAPCSDPLALARWAAYTKAYERLEEGTIDAALVAFEALAQETPQDPLVRLHLKRLHEGQHTDRLVLSEK